MCVCLEWTWFEPQSIASPIQSHTTTQFNLLPDIAYQFPSAGCVSTLYRPTTISLYPPGDCINRHSVCSIVAYAPPHPVDSYANCRRPLTTFAYRQLSHYSDLLAVFESSGSVNTNKIKRMFLCSSVPPPFFFSFILIEWEKIANLGAFCWYFFEIVVGDNCWNGRSIIVDFRVSSLRFRFTHFIHDGLVRLSNFSLEFPDEFHSISIVLYVKCSSTSRCKCIQIGQLFGIEFSISSVKLHSYRLICEKWLGVKYVRVSICTTQWIYWNVLNWLINYDSRNCL